MESSKDQEKSTPTSPAPAQQQERSPTEHHGSPLYPIANSPAHASAVTLTDGEKYAAQNEHIPGTCVKSGHPHPHANEDELKTLKRRIDIRLIPICSLLYLLCFLCRQNIGNAKTYHLLDKLPMTQSQYQIALSVFFFTYSTFDVPCNLALRKLGPKIWLPLVTLVSGAVTAAMGLVTNADELIATRVILGLTECGMFPGVAMLMCMWYVRRDVQFRQALFFGAASMAGAFSGLLAVPFANMQGMGGKDGWRWILIMEGLITMACAVFAYFLVPNTPEHATFLSDRERQILLHSLRNDEFGLKDDPENPENELDQEYVRGKLTAYRKNFVQTPREIIYLVFSRWHLYMHLVVFWGICAPLYVISLCLPSILKELSPEYTSTKANFFTIPVYISACILSIIIAYISDRKGKRAPFVIFAYTLMWLGFFIALVRPKSTPGLAYAGVWIAACGIYPAFPGMVTWQANNIGGGEKVRAISIAFHIGTGSLSGAAGANFISHGTRGKDGLYRPGYGICVGIVTAGYLAALFLWWRYKTVNDAREKKREKLLADFEAEVVASKKVWFNGAAHGTYEQENAWELKEREMRREFELNRQIDLVTKGNKSVWFIYTC